ncbi:N-acetylmuramoyl-L-alanine amidase [Gilliamella intestini]|uniref:N-acetylmuramoyl-L-alanine amidase n=1 Tax=Gilliamella intestini TaxID=1798183 RepID=A0A1C4DJP0_9GAMM|nr:N-acetylmuramoyl-L-alanine amidase [Gilliamella intestini]SCC31564.1 N-acetylmuramoyl-L-alanine amidase [Gilliamella intestini]
MEKKATSPDNKQSQPSQPDNKVLQPQTDSYSANPNQIVYDMVHQDDFIINVADVYFARKVLVLNKKDEYVYVKLNHANLGDKVYLVAKCYGTPRKGKLVLSLREIENTDTTQNLYSNNPVLFLVNGEEKTEIEYTLDGSITYAKEIELRPKDDKKYQELQEKLKNTKTKNTFLFVRAKIKETTAIRITFKSFFAGQCSAVDNLNYYDFLTENLNKFQLKNTRPVIVIDPGHGVTPGNEGAQARIYQYKLKGNNGEILKDAKGNVQTKTATVIDLPSYVLEAPDTWIIGNNDYSKSKNNKLDHKRTESNMVYEVSIKLYNLLLQKGYNVLITRNSKNVVKVANNKEAIYFRCDIANKNKADYFISIHADGLTNFTSGAHVIYYEGDKKGLELANDIFSCYTVVNIGKKHPDARNNVGVLGEKNQTKYKVLIELGYITHPKDAKSIYDNMDLIAEQLAQGLEININKHF